MQRECDSGEGGGESGRAMGGEWEFSNEWTGREKRERGARKEGREGGREGRASRGERGGEGAEGAGGGARLLSPLRGSRGRYSSAAAAAAAAAAPGRAALTLPREVARRGREGRAGAVGRGDYSISERRIGCIQSQSGCKLGPWPGRVGFRGARRGVGGTEGGVGRAWRGATFCSCHRVSSGLLPEHPSSSSRQLLFNSPSDGPQLSSLTPRLSSVPHTSVL